MTIHDILPRLRGVKGGQGQWTALCPAHQDPRNSLSISTGQDGRILFHCHAGCGVEAIAGALAEIGYEGDFTFEADEFLVKLPKPLKEDGSALMAKVGRYLIGRIEALSAAQNPKQQEKG